jgi:adenosylmethionine-8-amino-7-oxononanoate aminotransferase
LNITPDIQMNAKAVGSEFQAVASLMASQRVVQGLQRR